MSKHNKTPNLLDWLGIRSAPDWRVARPLGGIVAFLLGLLLVFAFIAAFVVVGHTIYLATSSSKEGINLGAGALIVALLGAPFLIWSTVIKHNTLETARKSLALQETAAFNDKVNDALQGLYSRRQITRPIKVGDEEKILTEWEDDIVQRNGAIDRLGGLARENPSEAPRIANILCVYVRELSKLSKPETHPRQAWKDLVEMYGGRTDQPDLHIIKQLGYSHEAEFSLFNLKKWAGNLRPFRTDVEKAVQILGQLKRISGVVVDDIILDLRDSNLQGLDLRELDLTKVKLTNARMEGANLIGARIEGADLTGARLEGANLRRAWMAGADLTRIGLEGAVLTFARLQRANLSYARLEWADLRNARFEGADLSGARLEGADMERAGFDASTKWTSLIDDAVLTGAAVQAVDFTKTPVSADQINQTFGDGSTQLPDHIPRPAQWPKAELAWLDFDTELEKYRANPAAYTPPDP